MKESSVNLGTIERALSGLASAFLFKKATEATGWARLPLAILGGFAAQRSLTGHSKIYETLGISSAEGARRLLHPALPEPPAMPLAELIEVSKAKEEVYDRLMALPEEALPKEEILAIHREGERVRVWLDDGQGMKEYELELVREVPGREIAFRGRVSDRIPSGEIHLADVGAAAGTLVSVYLNRKQSWLRNIGSAIGVDHDRKVVAKYLGYLKALLEEGSIAPEGLAHREDKKSAPDSRETDYH